MFSTSEKTALGGLRRAAGKEVELRSTNGQECPFLHCAPTLVSAPVLPENGHAEREIGQRLTGCCADLALQPKVTSGVAEIG